MEAQQNGRKTNNISDSELLVCTPIYIQYNIICKIQVLTYRQTKTE